MARHRFFVAVAAGRHHSVSTSTWARPAPASVAHCASTPRFSPPLPSPSVIEPTYSAQEAVREAAVAALALRALPHARTLAEPLLVLARVLSAAAAGASAAAAGAVEPRARPPRPRP